MSGEKPSIPQVYHEKIKEKKVAIVYASWHSDIVDKLRTAARDTLTKAGIEAENIFEEQVPGSFELPLGAQLQLEYNNVDGVVCLGCLVKGETPHFHYISEAVTLQMGQLGLRYNRPVGFGLLTVETEEQGKERAGGRWGNKGEETALAVLSMISMKEKMRKEKSKGQIGFGAG
jgi:6,7-dimethyl-8-ribityllumazine synthase